MMTNDDEKMAVCQVCGKEYRQKNHNQKFCSPECSEIARKQLEKERYQRWKAEGRPPSRTETRICDVCGKEYETTTRSKRCCCSVECSEIYRKRYYNAEIVHHRNRKKPEPPTKVNTSLQIMARAAHELGLTYGKLVEMTEKGRIAFDGAHYYFVKEG